MCEDVEGWRGEGVDVKWLSPCADEGEEEAGGKVRVQDLRENGDEEYVITYPNYID